MKINNEKYILMNTCAFDSVLQILCTAYCDSERYKDFIDKSFDFELGKL